MNSIKLYGHYMSIHIRSLMQYKISLLFTTIGQFLAAFGTFLTIYFLFSQFHEVDGYTYHEVLLCFSVMMMALSLEELFFGGFDAFAPMIGNGEFDRIMVRPRNEIFQIIAYKIDISRIGRVLQAAVVLVYAIKKGGLEWTGDKILTLVLMIIGGIAVFTGIFIIYAGLCFFTIEGLEFVNVFTYGLRDHGKYPLGIYGKWVMRFCTLIIPYTLFQYYPFLYLIGRAEHYWYRFLPILSLLFLIPCILFWKFGMRHYKSTGS